MNIHIRSICRAAACITAFGFLSAEESIRTLEFKGGVLGGNVEIQYSSYVDGPELVKMNDCAARWVARKVTEGDLASLKVAIVRNFKLSAGYRFAVVRAEHSGESGVLGLLFDEGKGDFEDKVRANNALFKVLCLEDAEYVVDRIGKRDIGEMDLRLGVKFESGNRFGLVVDVGEGSPSLVIRGVGRAVVPSDGVPSEVMQLLTSANAGRDIKVTYWYKMPSANLFTFGNGDYGVIKDGIVVDGDAEDRGPMFGVGAICELLGYRKDN